LTRLRGRSPFGAAKARASIVFRKILSKLMDCRVKPGNDGMDCFAEPVIGPAKGRTVRSQ
jgi:hypothetical protein